MGFCYICFFFVSTNRVLVKLAVQIGFSAASSVRNAKRKEVLAGRRWHVNAPGITVLAYMVMNDYILTLLGVYIEYRRKLLTL